MPAYDDRNFTPPAPIAIVTVRLPHTNAAVSNVPMLLDTGADATLLPRDRISTLIEIEQLAQHAQLVAFDGTKSTAPIVQLELEMLGKSFRGQFLLIDGDYGILGRNILNSLTIVLDGPAHSWNLSR
jgi:predicted aspartyl protease